jgi:hypothetical protein
MDALRQVGRVKIIWNMSIVTIISLCMCSCAIMLITSTSQWDDTPEINSTVTSIPICSTKTVGKSKTTTCDMDIAYIVDGKDYTKKLQTSSTQSKGNTIVIQYLKNDPDTIREKQMPAKYAGSGLSTCAILIFLAAGSYSYFAYNNDAMLAVTGARSAVNILR